MTGPCTKRKTWLAVYNPNNHPLRLKAMKVCIDSHSFYMLIKDPLCQALYERIC